jgi:hypothetical protein
VFELLLPPVLGQQVDLVLQQLHLLESILSISFGRIYRPEFHL